MSNSRMSEKLKVIRDITSKSMMHLTLTNRAGDIDGLIDKLSQPLSHHDQEMISKFTKLVSIKLNNEDLNSFPSIEAILQDEVGNEVLWTACCVNTGSDERGPYRLKGGILVTRVTTENQFNILDLLTTKK